MDNNYEKKDYYESGSIFEDWLLRTEMIISHDDYSDLVLRYLTGDIELVYPPGHSRFPEGKQMVIRDAIEDNNLLVRRAPESNSGFFGPGTEVIMNFDPKETKIVGKWGDAIGSFAGLWYGFGDNAIIITSNNYLHYDYNGQVEIVQEWLQQKLGQKFNKCFPNGVPGLMKC